MDDSGTRTAPPADLALAATLSPPTELTTDAALPSGIARYQRGDELGRGGMGLVCAAIDRQFGREVAVKTSLRIGDAPRAARLMQEAMIAGNLEHPGVLPVHERGIDDHGEPFYV